MQLATGQLWRAPALPINPLPSTGSHQQPGTHSLAPTAWYRQHPTFASPMPATSSKNTSSSLSVTCREEQSKEQHRCRGLGISA